MLRVPAMPTLLDALPALYAPLLPAFFRAEVPAERKATCANCAMCAPDAGAAVAPVDGVSRLFRPDTKCCTYDPRLPNYLVGALLADARPELAEGRRRVAARIAHRVGVTPQWLRPSPRYAALYDQARNAFGRSAALRCPYFDTADGGCTIWPYREAVCSTFFCKYVAAADGRKFWMSLKSYLTLAEIQLSRFAMFELCRELLLAQPDRGTGREDAPLGPDELDDQPPPAARYAATWGAWAGRETEFYVACFELVRRLGPADLERLLGFDGVIALATLERLHRAATAPALPAVLKLDPGATVQWLPDGSVALGAYSEFDAVALPGEAYALLAAFTGREPVAEVHARLRREKQADVLDDVLLVLYQHRVLVEP